MGKKNNKFTEQGEETLRKNANLRDKNLKMYEVKVTINIYKSV